MKKNVLIFGIALIVLSFSAYSFMNKSEAAPVETLISQNKTKPTPVKEEKEFEVFEDFIYEIGSRFSPMTKEEIAKVTSIEDLIPEDQIDRIVMLKKVEVIIFKDEKRSNIRVTGNSSEFSQEQLAFLQSLENSTNFVVNAEYQQKNYDTGQLEGSQSTPHLSIVPHKQASYLFGTDALKYFLKENSKEAREGVDPKKLKPAKLFFTVTKDGAIENVHLDRSSDYPLVDKKMIELISTAPGKWMPAENTQGEKVDQELVVSFGLMGC